MKPKVLSFLGPASLAFLAAPGLTYGQEQPNILWITSEDNSPEYLGCYGNAYATTPHIDELAESGITYNNAFANAPVSAPARFTIISGMYASNCGTERMRSTYEIPERFKFFPQYLREAGYYCTNNAKEDYNTVKPEGLWDESSKSAHYKNREKGQPFFAVFNILDSHESGIHYHRIRERGEFQHHPDSVNLTPYHPDVPEMRNCYAQYYDNITSMDRKVGKLLNELEERGLKENTIVFYYSDHGGVLPRSKRFLFNSGTRVAMVVNFPKKYRHLAPAEAGSRIDQPVSFVDLAPTVLRLAGLDTPEYMQGQPFAGKDAATESTAEFLFGSRMDEVYDLMRGVRTEKFLYIRNFMPHRIYGQHLWYLWRSSSVRAWKRAYKNGRCNAVQSRFWQTKPAEELYLIREDPHNINNLAENPEYSDVLKRLRRKTRRQMIKNGASGFVPEGILMRRAKGTTPYALTHAEDFPAAKIIETAEWATSRNPEDFSRLIDRFESDEPAIRYWVATGCAIMNEEAREVVPQLKAMLDDAYANNQIAAAEALCRLGITERPLQVLVKAMDYKNPKVQLHAVNVLRALGDIAKPVEKQLFGLSPWKERETYFEHIHRQLIKNLKPGWGDYMSW